MCRLSYPIKYLIIFCRFEIQTLNYAWWLPKATQKQRITVHIEADRISIAMKNVLDMEWCDWLESRMIKDKDENEMYFFVIIFFFMQRSAKDINMLLKFLYQVDAHFGISIINWLILFFFLNSGWNDKLGHWLGHLIRYM